MIQQTLNYVRKLNNYANKENLSMAVSLLRRHPKLSESEAATLNNLATTDVHE